MFFTLWWKALPDERAQALLPFAPDEALADDRFFLADLRRFRPFSLDERSEQLVNLKDADGIDAVLTLYSMLTNRLEYELEIDGEERELGPGGLCHVESTTPRRVSNASESEDLVLLVIGG